MQKNIEITREDYYQFNKYYFIKRQLRKRIYITIAVALTLPFLTAKENQFAFDSYFFSAIFSGIIFSLYSLISIYFTLKRTNKLPANNGSILGRKTFIITEEGLVEESDENRNIQKWNGLKSIESNNHYIFIFVDTIAAYIIPKRSFNSLTEQENFLNEIRLKTSHLG